MPRIGGFFLLTDFFFSLQILNMVAHTLPIQYAMDELQRLDELTDAVFLLWAPSDPGVFHTRLVQR